MNRPHRIIRENPRRPAVAIPLNTAAFGIPRSAVDPEKRQGPPVQPGTVTGILNEDDRIVGEGVVQQILLWIRALGIVPAASNQEFPRHLLSLIHI